MTHPRRPPLSLEQVEHITNVGGLADTFALLSCRPGLVELAVDGDRHAFRPMAYPGRLDLYVEPTGQLRPRDPNVDGYRP